LELNAFPLESDEKFGFEVAAPLDIVRRPGETVLPVKGVGCSPVVAERNA